MDVLRPAPGWFLGNLADPWVAAIAHALPESTQTVDAPGDLPEGLFESTSEPVRIVLHRAVLTRLDFHRVARWRGRSVGGSRLVLCFGPHVRHSELGQWGEIVDVSIPEATARETVAHHVDRIETSPLLKTLRSRSRIGVVSGLFSLRETIAEICESAGFLVVKAANLRDIPTGMPVVWDVPILEPTWPIALEKHSSMIGPVLALLSFADRANVSEARRAGAYAALDLPLDLAEIPALIDRLASRRADTPHSVPPAPAHWKRPIEIERVVESRRDGLLELN